jgi:hypothetical protein
VEPKIAEYSLKEVTNVGTSTGPNAAGPIIAAPISAGC